MTPLQNHWYIDPSNSSGLASDSNDGGSPRKPLLHWAVVVGRYGGIEPIISETTVFQFMSDPPNFLDPVVFRPVTINGASVFIYGGLVPVGTASGGKLSGVIAKNRASAQLLNASLAQPVSGSVGHILQNNTHPGRCWIDSVGGGANVAVLTQPLVPLTTVPPVRTPDSAPAEIDDFANSDSYTIVRPIKVNIVDFRPLTGDSDAAVDFTYGFLQQVWIPDPVAIGTSYCQLANVMGSECRIDRYVNSDPFVTIEGALHNTWANGSGFFLDMRLMGGAINTQAGNDCVLNAVNLDSDIVIHGDIDVYPSPGYLGIIVGLAYIDAHLGPRQGSARLTPTAEFGSGKCMLWGPGSLGPAVGGSIFFDTSASSQILTTGPLTLDAQTNNGTSYNPTSGVFTGGQTITVTNIDAAPGKALFNPQTGSRFAQYSA